MKTIITQSIENKITPTQLTSIADHPSPIDHLPEEVLMHLLSFIKENTPFLNEQDSIVFKVSRRFSAIYKTVCVDKVKEIVKKGLLASADFKKDFYQLSRLFQINEKHFLPLAHPYLKTLDLSATPITPQAFIELIQEKKEEKDRNGEDNQKEQALIKTPHLKKLDLILKKESAAATNADEEEADPQLQPVLHFLAEQKQLSSLKISALLSVNDLDFLCSQLISLEKLAIDFQGAESLLPRLFALTKLKQLQHLAISNIDYVFFDQDPLNEDFFRFFNQLKSLSLNMLEGDESDLLLLELLPFQRHFTHLEHFSWTAVNSDGLREWLADLPAPNQLSSLSIDINMIFSSEINHLRGLTGLEKLCLKEEIIDAAIETKKIGKEKLHLVEDSDLMEMLEDKHNLTELSLELIAITGDGIVAALKNCTRLEKIEISNCQRMTKENLIALLEKNPISSLKIERMDYETSYLDKNYCDSDPAIEIPLIYQLEKTFTNQAQREAYVAALKTETSLLLFDGDLQKTQSSYRNQRKLEKVFFEIEKEIDIDFHI